jgi:hypothetical protein
MPRFYQPDDAVTDRLFRGDSLSDALGDTVANGLVDISPILERARQYGLAYSFLQVTDDVGDQPLALGVVHDLAYQGAGLTEIIVVLSFCVSRMDEFSAGFPHLDLRILGGIGFWSAFGIRRVHWISDILDSH